jgi:hypothetical protein
LVIQLDRPKGQGGFGPPRTADKLRRFSAEFFCNLDRLVPTAGEAFAMMVMRKPYPERKDAGRALMKTKREHPDDAGCVGFHADLAVRPGSRWARTEIVLASDMTPSEDSSGKYRQRTNRSATA